MNSSQGIPVLKLSPTHTASKQRSDARKIGTLFPFQIRKQ